MPNKKLVEYLKRGMAEGDSLIKLKNDVLDNGWSAKEFKDALKHVNKKKSFKINKKTIFVLSFAIVLLVSVAIFIFSPKDFETEIYSVNDLQEGVSVEMENVVVEFGYKEDEIEKIYVLRADSSVARAKVGRRQIEFVFGEEKRLDLDLDGVEDVEIVYERLKNDVPSFFIRILTEEDFVKKVNYGAVRKIDSPEGGSFLKNITYRIENGTWYTENGTECVENLSCKEWEECVDGKRIMECKDIGNCGNFEYYPTYEEDCVVEVEGNDTVIEEPLENITLDEDNETFINETTNETLENETCVSDWSCGEWASCSESGEQNRTCLDLSACNETNLSYFEYQECVFEEQDPCSENNGIVFNSSYGCSGDVHYYEYEGENIQCCLNGDSYLLYTFNLDDYEIWRDLPTLGYCDIDFLSSLEECSLFKCNPDSMSSDNFHKGSIGERGDFCHYYEEDKSGNLILCKYNSDNLNSAVEDWGNRDFSKSWVSKFKDEMFRIGVCQSGRLQTVSRIG